MFEGGNALEIPPICTFAVASTVVSAVVHQVAVDDTALDVSKVDTQTENSSLPASPHESFHALVFLFQESSKAVDIS